MFFFLEFACFFYDPMDVDILISGSSVFSKSSLYIWKFSVRVLKPSLKDFVNYLASMLNEHNGMVVWILLGPCHKPFCAPDSYVLVCLPLVCIGHIDLGLTVHCLGILFTSYIIFLGCSPQEKEFVSIFFFVDFFGPLLSVWHMICIPLFFIKPMREWMNEIWQLGWGTF